MPRKELLAAGFRNLRLVLKHVKQRKAAQFGGYATNKAAAPTNAAAPPAKAPTTHAKQPATAASQRGRDGPAVPASFAAGVVAPPPPAASSSGVGGLLGTLKSAASALSQGAEHSPSFAAAPVWGKPSDAAPAPRVPPAAEHAPAAAAPAAPHVPAAVASNPLYKLATLGGKENAPPAWQAPSPAAEKVALGQYAKLGSAGSAAAKAAAGSGEAATHRLAGLLKYARLAKK